MLIETGKESKGKKILKELIDLQWDDDYPGNQVYLIALSKSNALETIQKAFADTGSINKALKVARTISEDNIKVFALLAIAKRLIQDAIEAVRECQVQF